MPVPYRTARTSTPPVPSAFVPEALNRKLGSGLGSPMSFETKSQTWDVVAGEAKVKQNIYTCLRTPIDRRLGQADYGSELPYMIFEEFTQVLRHEMIRATKGALSLWVPQIMINNVIVDTNLLQEHVVIILIEYVIRGTSATQTIKIAIGGDDVQLPPDIFHINNRPLIYSGGT